MKKLLSSVSLSALALCLTVQFAQGMDVVDEWVEVEEPNQQQSHNRILARGQENEPQLMHDIWTVVISLALEREPRLLNPIVRVCNDWHFFTTKKLSVSFAPWNSSLTDEILSKWPNIHTLNICGRYLGVDNKVTDKGLQSLSRLTQLNLSRNDVITDNGLQTLTNLTDLTLSIYGKVTDDGLKKLTNLLVLDLEDAGENEQTITAKGLQTLTNLTDLRIEESRNFSEDILKPLINLRRLHASTDPDCFYTYLKDEGMSHLVNLTDLSLTPCNGFTDKVLRQFTKLKKLGLQLEANTTITDEGMSYLTDLTELILYDNKEISANCLSLLPKLKSLALYSEEKIKKSEISQFTNLTELTIGYVETDSDYNYENLTNLKKLIIEDEDKDGLPFYTDEWVRKWTNLTFLKLPSEAFALFALHPSYEGLTGDRLRRQG